MEKCKKIFLPNEESQVNEIMNQFGWKQSSRKTLGRHIVAKYEREFSNPKLYSLEKKYSPRFVLPMWLLVVIALIAIALITVFVVRFAMRLENYNKLLDFACFMLPALLLIVIDAGVFMFRYLNLMKNIESFNSINLIKSEVSKLNG